MLWRSLGLLADEETNSWDGVGTLNARLWVAPWIFDLERTAGPLLPQLDKTRTTERAEDTRARRLDRGMGTDMGEIAKIEVLIPRFLHHHKQKCQKMRRFTIKH
jgi:hypothetical protein